jgi:hypothetical protein
VEKITVMENDIKKHEMDLKSYERQSKGVKGIFTHLAGEKFNSIVEIQSLLQQKIKKLAFWKVRVDSPVTTVVVLTLSSLSVSLFLSLFVCLSVSQSKESLEKRFIRSLNKYCDEIMEYSDHLTRSPSPSPHSCSLLLRPAKDPSDLDSPSIVPSTPPAALEKIACMFVSLSHSPLSPSDPPFCLVSFPLVVNSESKLVQKLFHQKSHRWTIIP